LQYQPIYVFDARGQEVALAGSDWAKYALILGGLSFIRDRNGQSVLGGLFGNLFKGGDTFKKILPLAALYYQYKQEKGIVQQQVQAEEAARQELQDFQNYLNQHGANIPSGDTGGKSQIDINTMMPLMLMGGGLLMVLMMMAMMR